MNHTIPNINDKNIIIDPQNNENEDNLTNGNVDNNGENDEICCSGVEHHLIGLSPQYWSYTPLFIADIQTLHLINGLSSCLVIPPTLTFPDRKECRKSSVVSTSNVAKRILPLSKCELVGIVTYAHTKSNHSTHYIVDDGTDRIDCVSWNSNGADYNNSIMFPVKYRLSSLPYDSSDSRMFPCRTGWEDGDVNGNRSGGKKEIQVGDLVRVLGWMKCVSIIGPASRISIENPDGRNATVWETRQCVREVHIHKIQRLEEDPFIHETVHWLKCLQFMRRVQNSIDIGVDGSGTISEIEGKSSETFCREERNSCMPYDDMAGNDDGSYRFQCRLIKSPVYNGTDVMKSITPSLHSKSIPLITNSVPDNDDILNKETHDSTGQRNRHFDVSSRNASVDDVIERSHYGKDCTCSTTGNINTYRETLLYCHCLATNEPLDQGFRFRDALLDRLLDMERKLLDTMATTASNGARHGEYGSMVTRKRQRVMGSDNEVNIDTEMMYKRDNKTKNDDTTKAHVSFCLQFSYEVIAQDPKLKKIAHQTTDSSNVRRLYTNTFQWLRKDGIIHLLDVDTDIYILLSMDRVLIPSMRSFIRLEEEWKVDVAEARKSTSIVPPPPLLPPFLKVLPFAKCQLVKNIAMQEHVIGNRSSSYV